MVKLWLFKLKSISRHLSFRAAAFAMLAVASSLIGVIFRDYVPEELADLAGGRAVDGILTMMASSMLIVVTFSLSTMLSAYSAATQVATPRATELIIDDSKSHSTISVFLGAFIYSIVSLIALSTGYYGEKGRVILLAITVAVLTTVVIIVIRWVEDLKNMGSVRETIRRVEKRTSSSLAERMKKPTFGCQHFLGPPDSAFPVWNLRIGYIQNIDLSRLSEIAEEEAFSVYVQNEIGAFIYLKSPLAVVGGSDRVNEDTIEKIRQCFVIGDSRTFSSDPRYGIATLAGIGVKALSASLNDPGTAIDVISALVRVMSIIEVVNEEQDEHRFPRIYFPKLRVQDLFNDAFYLLGQDGVAYIPVLKRLDSALDALSGSNRADVQKAISEHKKLMQERIRLEYKLETDLKNIESDYMIGERQR